MMSCPWYPHCRLADLADESVFCKGLRNLRPDSPLWEFLQISCDRNRLGASCRPAPVGKTVCEHGQLCRGLTAFKPEIPAIPGILSWHGSRFISGWVVAAGCLLN